MRSHPQFGAYLALAAVCFFWGTTYLGIRMALESFPPATLVCIRYMLSGSLMTGAALAMRIHIPAGREMLLTSLFGVIILGVGNGCLAFAEQWVPSGLAALFITLSPFWLVGMEALLPGGGARLHGPTLIGMLVGLAGTLLLVAPGTAASPSGKGVLAGFLLLQLGSCGWSLGSILQRRHRTTAHPAINGAVQQLATGMVYLIPAVLVPHAPIRWNMRGVGALLYLVTFGSIVGYSAYIYALQHLPVPVVALYNYVNPVVAVLLGYVVYRERLGWREIVAMLVIFSGVALVRRANARA